MFPQYVRLSSRQLLTTLLLAGAALSACSGDDDKLLDADVIGPGGARVELVFGVGRIDLVRGTPMAQPPTELGLPSDLGDDLRWELIDRNGVKLAEGSAPDSRLVSFEPQAGETAMPKMKAPSGQLTLELPDAAGTLRLFDSAGILLGELAIDRLAEPYSADGWTGKADIDWTTDLIGQPTLISGDGATERRFNLLFVPEGYTEAELPKFEQDLATMWGGVATTDVYKDHLNLINVWRQNIKSAESGVSDPRGNANKDTAFNTTFGDDISTVRRCLWPSSNWSSITNASINRLKQTVNADVVIVIANTNEWAGCATPGFIVQSVPSSGGDTVLAHELGHALFGLADEYEESGRSCRSAPNVTTNLSVIPWRDMILPNTPIPTTYDNSSNLPDGYRTVGAWQGGGYCATGAWRPAYSCKMRSSYDNFCPVCARVATTKLEAMGGGTGGGTCSAAPAVAAVASTDDGNKPKNVLDNNIDTRWSANGNGQWITLDAGNERKFSAIDIAWYKGDRRASNYVISVSSDGTSFSAVASGRSSGDTNYKERVTFVPVTARYIRITVNGNTDNSWASITEAIPCALPSGS
ncbi:MAG: M64 family metallopeptidase [Kofleriaceae bacterium]